MRKIEALMNRAIQTNKNWSNANTSVTYCPESEESKVYLHGNHIATVGDNFLQIFDGGWQSNTTKSRLNALINEFCNGFTDGVFQKNFEWFITDNNVTRDFENGYIFAWMSGGILPPLFILTHTQLKPIPSHCNDELLPWFVFMLTKKLIGGITSIRQPEV